MKQVVRIYGLCSTRDESDIRYIGKTIRPLRERLDQHKFDRKKTSKRNHKDNWISKEMDDGYKILIKLIDTGDESNWEELEVYWIAEYKRLGYNLTNTELGGGINGEQLNARCVVVLDRVGKYINEYKSVALTSRELNLKYKKIGECLNVKCKKKSIHGYQFVYKDDYDESKNYDIRHVKKVYPEKILLSHDELSKIYKINSLKAREVNMKPIGRFDLDWNLIESYSCRVDACKNSDYKIHGIDKVLAGQRHTHKGFNWRYI